MVSVPTPAAAVAAAQNAPPSHDNAAKRKMSLSDIDDDSDSDSDSPDSSSKKLFSTGRTSASQQLVPVPGQPDAPLVTKRTLQNRKAQREFRKRREARVRELEERCRRFDQMGLEANTELQRLAHRLKDENEALKSLIARLGFAHMIPGIIESINNVEQPQHHHAQHPHHQHTAPHHPHAFAPLDIGMDAWASRASGMPITNAAPLPPHSEAPVQPSNAANAANAAAATNKKANRSHVPTTSASVPASTPISSLANLPGLTELLPVHAGGVNPSMLSDGNSSNRDSQRASGSSIAAVAVPAEPKSTTTTSRPIEDNSTFDNDWFAQLAQSGHDKDDNNVDAASTDNTALSRNVRSAANPILSLNFNNNSTDIKNTKSSNHNYHHHLSGSAMLGANARPFGLGLASALSLAQASSSGANMFPMPMPTQQNGALLNPNPIPFAFNLSENKMPGEQSWWSQVAGNALEGDDSILDEKAQAVAQATGANQNGAPSPFDLSAFLNGGLTPGGGGFTFGSQQTNDDTVIDAQKSTDNDDASKPSNGKGGQTQQGLTQAEHAQMFLRLLEAKMAKGNTSTYAQLGFQPPMHHQQYAASQAGPSFSDASSSSSLSSSLSSSPDKEEDSALSPINIYTRLAQHPAFLSTNASELEELVDSISSSQQRQQQMARFQPPLSKRKGTTPTKVAPTLYPPPASALTPSIYAPNGAGPLAGTHTNDLEVDEKAVNKMLGMLDRKSSKNAPAAGSALAF